MTEASYRIIMNKVANSIKKGLEGIPDPMNFEQLGRVLTLLDVFHIVSFDELFQCKEQIIFKLFSKSGNKYPLFL